MLEDLAFATLHPFRLAAAPWTFTIMSRSWRTLSSGMAGRSGRRRRDRRCRRRTDGRNRRRFDQHAHGPCATYSATRPGVRPTRVFSCGLDFLGAPDAPSLISPARGQEYSASVTRGTLQRWVEVTVPLRAFLGRVNVRTGESAAWDTMDRIDAAILEVLQADGRLPNAALAGEGRAVAIGLLPTARPAGKEGLSRAPRAAATPRFGYRMTGSCTICCRSSSKRRWPISRGAVKRCPRTLLFVPSDVGRVRLHPAHAAKVLPGTTSRIHRNG